MAYNVQKKKCRFETRIFKNYPYRVRGKPPSHTLPRSVALLGRFAPSPRWWILATPLSLA